MRYYVVKGDLGLTVYRVPLDHQIQFENAFREQIVAMGLTLWDAVTGAGFNMHNANSTLN
jgi:hypothetical protein